MRHVCVLSFCIAISVCLSFSGCSGRDNPSSPNSPDKSGPASLTEEQIAAGEQFATNLRSQYRRNGFDIEVRVDHFHSLTLTSDLFKDYASREKISGELIKNSGTLCRLGIWYVFVGYSKGAFSSDVLKKASVDCPAARAEAEAAMKPQREEFLKAVNAAGGGQVRAYFVDRTLVYESEFFFDDKQGGRAYMNAQAQQALQSYDKLCALGADRVLITGKIQKKSVPLNCD
jgi:hypothetical protein